MRDWGTWLSNIDCRGEHISDSAINHQHIHISRIHKFPAFILLSLAATKTCNSWKSFPPSTLVVVPSQQKAFSLGLMFPWSCLGISRWNQRLLLTPCSAEYILNFYTAGEVFFPPTCGISGLSGVRRPCSKPTLSTCKMEVKSRSKILHLNWRMWGGSEV